MGDECLRNVAKVIFAVCGTKCVTARYGGDEFVIICENVSKEWVEDVAKSLVSKVAELKMESEDSPISDYVSVSVGAYYGKIAYKETLRSLVEKADKGLYKVKGNFELMLHWDEYFGAGEASTVTTEDKKKSSKGTNMLLVLMPWIVFWIAVSINGYIGSLISIVCCVTLPLIFFSNKKTIYDIIYKKLRTIFYEKNNRLT